MSDATYLRLAIIARALEDHAAAIWLLERERDQLRMDLRRANASPAQPSRDAHAA